MAAFAICALLGFQVAPLPLAPRPASTGRSAPPAAKLFSTKPLKVGEQWEGLVSKITDYGFFAKLGHEQHMGMVHISTLTTDRIPKMEIAGWIEENVGPVGSKVRVEVLTLEHKGVKRTSLRLLDVIQKQHMEDLVFEPGPRRAQNFGTDEE